VYASEGCGSSHYPQPSAYRNVNRALFYAAASQPSLANPKAVQKCSCLDFVGATTKIRRRWEFTREIFGIVLVSVLVGAMLGDGGLTARR
jgi:hypothetical protein